MQLTQKDIEQIKKDAHEKEEKELAEKLDKANAENTGKVHFPEYFAKKKKRMSPGFIEMLVETAKSDFTDVDDYGVYKTGTFLYKSAMVSVSKENGLWTLHMMSDNPIGLPLIKEIRYHFLPDNIMMVQVFGTRVEAHELKGIVLYQLPTSQTEDEE
jgi:hypothetical protein